MPIKAEASSHPTEPQAGADAVKKEAVECPSCRGRCVSEMPVRSVKGILMYRVYTCPDCGHCWDDFCLPMD